MDGGAAGEAFVVSGMHGIEHLLLFTLQGTEVLRAFEDLDTAETAQSNTVAGLTEAESGLVDRIHEIRIVDNQDLATRRFTSHGGGCHLELTQIHSSLPNAGPRPDQRRGIVAGSRPESVLFGYFGVRLRISLCGVQEYASAQILIFLDLARKASFPNRELLGFPGVSGWEPADSPKSVFEDNRPRRVARQDHRHQTPIVQFGADRKIIGLTEAAQSARPVAVEQPLPHFAEILTSPFH